MVALRAETKRSVRPVDLFPLSGHPMTERSPIGVGAEAVSLDKQLKSQFTRIMNRKLRERGGGNGLFAQIKEISPSVLHGYPTRESDGREPAVEVTLRLSKSIAVSDVAEQLKQFVAYEVGYKENGSNQKRLADYTAKRLWHYEGEDKFDLFGGGRRDRAEDTEENAPKSNKEQRRENGQTGTVVWIGNAEALGSPKGLDQIEYDDASHIAESILLTTARPAEEFLTPELLEDSKDRKSLPLEGFSEGENQTQEVTLRLAANGTRTELEMAYLVLALSDILTGTQYENTGTSKDAKAEQSVGPLYRSDVLDIYHRFVTERMADVVTAPLHVIAQQDRTIHTQFIEPLERGEYNTPNLLLAGVAGTGKTLETQRLVLEKHANVLVAGFDAEDMGDGELEGLSEFYRGVAHRFGMPIVMAINHGEKLFTDENGKNPNVKVVTKRPNGVWYMVTASNYSMSLATSNQLMKVSFPMDAPIEERVMDMATVYRHNVHRGAYRAIPQEESTQIFQKIGKELTGYPMQAHTQVLDALQREMRVANGRDWDSLVEASIQAVLPSYDLPTLEYQSMALTQKGITGSSEYKNTGPNWGFLAGRQKAS